MRTDTRPLCQSVRFFETMNIYNIYFSQILLLFAGRHVKLSTIAARAAREETPIAVETAKKKALIAAKAAKKEAFNDPY